MRVTHWGNCRSLHFSICMRIDTVSDDRDEGWMDAARKGEETCERRSRTNHRQREEAVAVNTLKAERKMIQLQAKASERRESGSAEKRQPIPEAGEC